MWSSGKDSALPLRRAWVQPMVEELRSHMTCSMAKKKKMCSLEPFDKKTLRHISDVVTRGGFTEKSRINA